MSDFITKTEAAGMIGVSRQTLRRMEKDGEGPPRYELGETLTKYRREDVERWLEAHRIEPNDDAGMERAS